MEVAGLVISGVGVVALASNVSECFQQIDTARNLGKDYQDLVLQLELAHLGYDRWCRNVEFVDSMNGEFDGRLPVATVDEVKTVKKLLGSIKVAFDTAHETSKRFELDEKASASTVPEVVNSGAHQTATVQLADRIRAVSKQQQKAATIIDKIRWTLFDAKILKELVSNIDRNVNSLVRLFPAIGKTQKEQAVTDVAAIVPMDAYSTESEEKLKVLHQSSAGADPALCQVIRNQYFGIDLEDPDDVVFGNEFLAMQESGEGYGHSYRDIRVKRGRKMVFGNRHGQNVGGDAGA